jgi:hypothetical protein
MFQLTKGPRKLDLHHFYHIYADGSWYEPVSEHITALRRNSFDQQLASINIGIVGSLENTQAVKQFLNDQNLTYTVIAEQEFGWEQVTLELLHKFSKENDGIVIYAHSKGSAHPSEINTSWRRSMEYHNFIQWEIPKQALIEGKYLAGCHWLVVSRGTPDENMFYGGTYWWARCDAVRLNSALGYINRYFAEHWIGQLRHVLPLVVGRTILDMSEDVPIAIGYLKDDWI